MKQKEEPIITPGHSPELGSEVEKLKHQILEAKKSSANPPKSGLNEMIEKLKKEVDYELSEAANSLGLSDKFVMLHEEFEKARNSKDHPISFALKEKIEKLKAELNQGLPSAPNFANLKYELDMLREVSAAKNQSE